MHLDWPKRLNMAMDAAKGMLHLHLCDPPIIHRDLKSPNLLVDKHWRVKVRCFGLPPREGVPSDCGMDLRHLHAMLACRACC